MDFHGIEIPYEIFFHIFVFKFDLCFSFAERKIFFSYQSVDIAVSADFCVFQ